MMERRTPFRTGWISQSSSNAKTMRSKKGAVYVWEKYTSKRWITRETRELEPRVETRDSKDQEMLSGPAIILSNDKRNTFPFSPGDKLPLNRVEYSWSIKTIIIWQLNLIVAFSQTNSVINRTTTSVSCVSLPAAGRSVSMFYFVVSEWEKCAELYFGDTDTDGKSHGDQDVNVCLKSQKQLIRCRCETIRIAGQLLYLVKSS